MVSINLYDDLSDLPLPRVLRWPVGIDILVGDLPKLPASTQSG